MTGYPLATCSSNRLWKFENSSDEISRRPVCRRITCEPPPHVDNAFALNRSYSYDEFVVYTCESGYEINTNSSDDLHCTAEKGDSKVLY